MRRSGFCWTSRRPRLRFWMGRRRWIRQADGRWRGTRCRWKRESRCAGTRRGAGGIFWRLRLSTTRGTTGTRNGSRWRRTIWRRGRRRGMGLPATRGMAGRIWMRTGRGTTRARDRCGSRLTPSVSGFDPYGYGSWVWSGGTGYVWNSAYSWGWTPFRCGSWNYWQDFGWGWAPSAGCGYGGGLAYGGFGPGRGRRGNRINLSNVPAGYRRPMPPVAGGPVRVHPIIPVRTGPGPTGERVRPFEARQIAGQTAMPLRTQGSGYTPRGGSAVGSTLRRDFPVDQVTGRPVLGLATAPGGGRRGPDEAVRAGAAPVGTGLARGGGCGEWAGRGAGRWDEAGVSGATYAGGGHGIHAGDGGPGGGGTGDCRKARRAGKPGVPDAAAAGGASGPGADCGADPQCAAGDGAAGSSGCCADGGYAEEVGLVRARKSSATVSSGRASARVRGSIAGGQAC